ncbi:MAG: cyclic nucleotide-binding domain-containing protein [Actinobacteria bacterium]|nr:cyclic nucleotide-binding domain-containing protein [Actinomycetota bacterium]
MDEPRLSDRVALLRGGWLFSECTDDELERIAALAHGLRVPAGHVVVREGDEGSEFFVVADGAARVSVGDGTAVADLGAGSFFGEMALLDGGERVATVTAITELELLVLHRDEFNEMLAFAMPTLAPKLLAVVGRRVRELEARQGRGVPFGA